MTRTEYIAKFYHLITVHNRLVRKSKDQMISVDQAIDYKLRAEKVEARVMRMAAHIDRIDDDKLNKKIDELRRVVAAEKATRARKSFWNKARGFVESLAVLAIGVRLLDKLYERPRR